MKDAHHGLTSDQTTELAERGVTRLPGAVPAPDVAAMLDVLWSRLAARCGAVRDRPETWSTHRPAQLTTRTDEFAAMASPPVRTALDSLLGGWKTPPRWGLPLVTFPGFDRRWDVPHTNWHLDTAATAQAPRVARLFLVLNASEPGGGGTGYVEGSHRVIRRLAAARGGALSSAQARKMLAARSPWFAGLESVRPGEDRVARFVADGDVVDGVPVRVREMTGAPGDVIVMDPLMLHAMTPNVGDAPRLMLTTWVYGR